MIWIQNYSFVSRLCHLKNRKYNNSSRNKYQVKFLFCEVSVQFNNFQIARMFPKKTDLLPKEIYSIIIFVNTMTFEYLLDHGYRTNLHTSPDMVTPEICYCYE